MRIQIVSLISKRQLSRQVYFDRRTKGDLLLAKLLLQNPKMKAKKRSMVVNNGFGPQITGKESVAELFSRKGLRLTKRDRLDKAIRANLDPDLVAEVQEFDMKLSRKTPMHKYELLMLWLEHRISDITLKKQAKSKQFYKMLRNDVTLEETKNIRGVAFPGSIIPQSSLVGQDRFGDKPLPEACYEKDKQDDSDGDSDAGGSSNTGQKKYSQMGLLVKHV